MADERAFRCPAGRRLRCAWRRAALLAIALAGAAASAPAQDAAAARAAGTPELMRSLAQGGYVIYFRHGHTHWQQKIIEQAMQAEGRHDLANCATQRNLDATGRDDARRIHAALHAARVPVGKVLASLYCRPAEYVGLITGKASLRTRWLTGLSTPETLLEIKREVATPPEPGTNTFLGGHGDRPFDLTGLVIQEGDALVFDPRNHQAGDPGKFKPVAWIKPAQWSALARAAAPAAEAAPALGRISVAAAAHHDAGNVVASLPTLTPGATLDRDALARTLQLARENPAKNIEVALTPAALATDSPDAVDAAVAVADTKPWAVTAGLSHASAHPPSAGGGQDRLWLGAEHANLWNRDHQAALLVSQAARSHEGNASLAYRAPLPGLATMLGLVATRARDGGGIDAELAPVTGSGRALTLYARRHLVPRADYHHQAQASVSDRDWSGPGQPGVRSRPLTLGYAGHWEEEWVGWKFGASGTLNLPGGSGNDAAHYALATAHAATSSHWNALRVNAEVLRVLTYDIRLRVSGRAQWSSQALIAGEQFALGGALEPWGSAFGVWQRAPWIHRDGVRGLPERAVAGDSGAVASAELWSRRLLGQDLRAGAFVDLGAVRRNRAASGVADSASASTLGLNAHFQLRGQVALALSTAHVLHGGNAAANGATRVDLVLVARY